MSPASESMTKLRSRRQGDVIALGRVALAKGNDFDQLNVPTSLGVVLTQTCDLVRPPTGEKPRPYIAVSPVTRADAVTMQSVVAGRIPSMAAVPWAGENFVADLEVVQTMDKETFLRLEIKASPSGDDERRRFAYAVGRKFARAAIPDKAQESIEKLRNRVRDKSSSSNSVEGRLLDTLVHSLRVEPDPDWTNESIEIRIVLLVDDLPKAAPDTPRRAEVGYVEAVEPAANRATRAADRIVKGGHDESTTVWLWESYASSLAALCEPLAPVVAITSEVVRTSDYGVDRFWGSDDIDLDYLSVNEED